MKYLEVSKKRALLLNDGITAAAVSAACREAGLELLAGAAEWGKIELARWLSGPYARATSFAWRGERTVVASSPLHVPDVDQQRLDDVVASARKSVLEALERSIRKRAGTLDFASEIVERGYVRCGQGAEGDEIWFPVDLPRLRLRDRVLALFVADYLDDFVSYADLHVCPSCAVVAFADGPCQPGYCALYRGPSGIQVKDEPLDAPQPRRAGGDDSSS